jgi:hypothetical protein
MLAEWLSHHMPGLKNCTDRINSAKKGCRNESRRLSLMAAQAVNSGTRIDSLTAAGIIAEPVGSREINDGAADDDTCGATGDFLECVFNATVAIRRQ